MIEQFTEILEGLSEQSQLLYLDADASRVSSLFSLSIARSGKYMYQKAGTCLLYEDSEID